MKTVLSRGYSETLYFNSSYWSNCCASFQEQCIAFFMKNIVAIIFFKITTYRGLDFITVFVKYYSMDQTTLWGGPGPRFEPGTGGCVATYPRALLECLPLPKLLHRVSHVQHEDVHRLVQLRQQSKCRLYPG